MKYVNDMRREHHGKGHTTNIFLITKHIYVIMRSGIIFDKL